MDHIEIKVISSDTQKLLVWFYYHLTTFTVQLLDKICLFEYERHPDSRQTVASVRVSNPRGHWPERSGKAGQVVLDISEVNISQERNYQLGYVRTSHTGQETLLTSTVLAVRPSDGVLVEQQDLPSSENLGFSLVSGNSSIDTNSFDFGPSSSDQPSSSFVVVSEGDSQRLESEEISSGIKNAPENFTNSPVLSHKPLEPQLIDSTEPQVEDNTKDLIDFEDSSPVVASVPNSQLTREPGASIHFKDDESVSSEHSTSVVPPEMSLSVNIGGEKFISQKEALMYKNANRDLLQKQKKLMAIMQKMKEAKSTEDIDALKNEIVQLKKQRDELLLKYTETEEQLIVEIAEKQTLQAMIISLKKKLLHLEQQIQALKEENEVLRENSQAAGKEQAQQMSAEIHSLRKDIEVRTKKISQLTLERDTQFARSSTLLSELQDKEQEYEVMRSENLVLQGKLKRLETEKKKLEMRSHKEAELRRVKEIDSRIKQRDPEPVKTHQSPSKPLENGINREKEPQALSNRPTDLPLAGGARLKPTPPPANTQQSRAHDAQHKQHRQAAHDLEPARKPSVSASKHQEQVTPRQRDQASAPKPQPSIKREAGHISERRVEEITQSLRGAPTVVCPICQKVLHARQNEYSVLLHVEHCLSKAS